MEFGDFITEKSKQQGNRLPFKSFKSIEKKNETGHAADDSPIRAKAGGGRKSTVKQPKGHEAAKRNQAYGGESEEQYNPPKYKAIKQELRDNDGKGQVMVPGKPPYSKNALGPKKPQIVRGDVKKVEKELEGEGGKEAVQKLIKKNLEKTYKKDSKGHPKLEEEATLLRGMAEMFEEFKPFPKDKVERKIEKKKKSAEHEDATVGSAAKDKKQAHSMTAVKNFRTKMTDASKATQKYTGSDKEKSRDRVWTHVKAREKADEKSDKSYEKREKLDKKADKAADKMVATERKVDKKTLDKHAKKHPTPTEKSGDKLIDKMVANKNNPKVVKARKKFDKAHDKWNKADDKWRGHRADSHKHERRRNTGEDVRMSAEKGNRNRNIRWTGSDGDSGIDKRKTDLEKQAEVNRKDKADRASAKSSLDRAGLEGALKAKPKREKMKGPKMKNVIKKESMNFTEFLNSTTQPLYEKEGEVPKCPPGYKYDVKMMMCVPKTNKDSIGRNQKEGNKDMKPGNGASYNVWGNSGYSGAGFAWEEGPTNNDVAGGQE